MSKKMKIVLGITSFTLIAVSIAAVVIVVPKVRLFNYLNTIDAVIDKINKVEKLSKEAESISFPSDFDKKSSKAFDESTKQFKSKLSIASKELEAAKNEMKNASAPADAESFHSDINEYIEFADTSLTELEYVVDYFQLFAKAIMPFSDLSENEPESDDIEVMKKYSKSTNASLDKLVSDLKTAKPPAQLRNINKGFIDVFNDLAEAFDLLAQGLEASDLAKLEKAENKLTSLDNIDKQLDKDYKSFDAWLDKMIKEEDNAVKSLNQKLDGLRNSIF